MSLRVIFRPGSLLFLIILIGIVLRLWLITISPLDPSFSNADDGDYYRRALRFALTGQYLDDAWLIRPPLHVFFFAVWIRLAMLLGQPLHIVQSVQLAQTAVAALTIVLGYGIARRLFHSSSAGLIFAAFLAIWQPFVEQADVLFSELLYLFLFMLHIWLLLRYEAESWERRNLGRAGLDEWERQETGDRRHETGDTRQETRDSRHETGDTRQQTRSMGTGGVGGQETGRGKDQERGGLVCMFLSGIALGLAALTRSPALYSLAFVVLWIFLRPSSGLLKSLKISPDSSAKGHSPSLSGHSPFNIHHSIFLAVVVITGCLVVVLPWTARNYMLYGQLIPVDTLGQINLWLDMAPVANRSSNIDFLRTLPQAERAPYALARARELLAERPLRLIDNAWPNFRHIWKAQFIEDFFLKSSFFTRPLREMAPLGLLGDALWLVFTLMGLIRLVGRPHEGWHWRIFFLAWIAYSIVTVIVFHVEPRYLTPLWTIIALYGAAGLAGLRRQATQKSVEEKVGSREQNAVQPSPHHSVTSLLRHFPVLQIAITLAFLALLLSYRDYPAIIERGMTRERAMRAAEQAYLQGSYPAAERFYAEALQAQPYFVDAALGQALSLTAQGQLEQAHNLIRNGGSRQADLLRYSLEALQSPDQESAATAMALIDDTAAISGEDSQAWLMRWLHRAPVRRVYLGTSDDIGRIQGFYAIERDATGSYRWLRGQGRIQLSLAQPISADDTLVLRLNAGQDKAVLLTIQIGDASAQTLVVTGGEWRRYRLSMPAAVQGNTQIQITLSAPTFVPALRNTRSNDLRLLSLMLSEVGVE